MVRGSSGLGETWRDLALLYKVLSKFLRCRKRVDENLCNHFKLIIDFQPVFFSLKHNIIAVLKIFNNIAGEFMYVYT